MRFHVVGCVVVLIAGCGDRAPTPSPAPTPVVGTEKPRITIDAPSPGAVVRDDQFECRGSLWLPAGYDNAFDGSVFLDVSRVEPRRKVSLGSQEAKLGPPDEGGARPFKVKVGRPSRAGRYIIEVDTDLRVPDGAGAGQVAAVSAKVPFEVKP